MLETSPDWHNERVSRVSAPDLRMVENFSQYIAVISWPLVVGLSQICDSHSHMKGVCVCHIHVRIRRYKWRAYTCTAVTWYDCTRQLLWALPLQVVLWSHYEGKGRGYPNQTAAWWSVPHQREWEYSGRLLSLCKVSLLIAVVNH